MKENKIYLILTFFMGMILGFLLSPAKGGFGNNAGNNIKIYYGDKFAPQEEQQQS